QAISRFDVIDLKQPAAARTGAPSAVEPAARRHWLITFDRSYSSLSGLLRAREGAKAFVVRAVRNGDLAAVSTLSVESGWKLLLNFTADRDQLSRAIDTLGVSPLALESLDPLSFAFEPPGRSGIRGDDRLLEA